MRRIVPVDAHILALSWSPQYCRRAPPSAAFQCGDNRFGFVLHGLWPQGPDGRDLQYCRAAKPLTAALLRSNLCTTPSVDLLQHEWAKHGTCMARSPRQYFDQARRAYGNVRFPDMAKLTAAKGLTVGRFIAAFVSANGRNLTARSMVIRLTRNGWLQEVQLCLDRQRNFATCRARREHGAHPARTMRIHSPR